MTDDHPAAQAIRDEYYRRTPTSRARCERACRFLPGGDTRTSVYWQPYPTYVDWGTGCTVCDADGNSYLDFHNNFTSLIHGHAHPAVVAAIRAQAARGLIFGAPAECQIELASMLCDRVPSVERVRFCNSGSEATMVAMRLARAYTGKEGILKVDGGYHGSHDFADVNITPNVEVDGIPPLRRENRGVPGGVLDSLLVVPFNDLVAAEQVIRTHRHRLAAMIVEPILNAGGLVCAREGYLSGLRRLADQYGILLVFDEIVTFRLSRGGWQQVEGVRPDITTLGKIIGGGFGVGAVCGGAEIMELFNPKRPDGLRHSGTFNGQSVVMAAGIANLAHFEQPEIDRVNRLGERMRRGLAGAFRSNGLRGTISGQGSLAYMHWTTHEIVTSADAARAARAAGRLVSLLQLGLLNRGIWVPYRGELCVSTPMTEREIDRLVEMVGDVLRHLRPYVEQEMPHLLA